MPRRQGNNQDMAISTRLGRVLLQLILDSYSGFSLPLYSPLCLVSEKPDYFAKMSFATHPNARFGFNEPDFLTTNLERLRNYNEDHIPMGVHWDLQDNVPDVFSACDREPTIGSIPCGAIRDNISLLTTSQLFSILTSDVTDPWLYRDKLKAVYNLNPQEVDNLFEDYLNTQ